LKIQLNECYSNPYPMSVVVLQLVELSGTSRYASTNLI
jgi:hypothetical protein